MVIFHSYVSLPEGNSHWTFFVCPCWSLESCRIPFWNPSKVSLRPWTRMALAPSIWKRSRSCFRTVPSGKHTKNYGKSWKITSFNGKTHYKWPFSIAMLVYQRVTEWNHCSPDPLLLFHLLTPQGSPHRIQPLQHILRPLGRRHFVSQMGIGQNMSKHISPKWSIWSLVVSAVKLT